MIKSKRYLLYILQVSSERLDYILGHLDEFYYSFDRYKINKLTGRPKRDANGNLKTRTINSSKGELKNIQSRIYQFLLSNVTLPDFFFGGVKGKNNILNARYHQGNKFIFTTDLKSFFPSISNKKVYETLVSIGFSPNIARIITKLITRNHQVPQGIPTSTLIANLVFMPVGLKISDLAQKHNIKFTIYVDDITLSSPTDFQYLLPQFLEIINSNGFRISHDKTFYKTRNPIVTGVVVHNNNLRRQPGYDKIIARLKMDDSSQKSLIGVMAYLKRIDEA